MCFLYKIYTLPDIGGLKKSASLESGRIFEPLKKRLYFVISLFHLGENCNLGVSVFLTAQTECILSILSVLQSRVAQAHTLKLDVPQVLWQVMQRNLQPVIQLFGKFSNHLRQTWQKMDKEEKSVHLFSIQFKMFTSLTDSLGLSLTGLLIWHLCFVMGSYRFESAD